ncbi:MAG: hypothetical protein AB9873_05310 [Syntrophobacteraceae bacterium]
MNHCRMETIEARAQLLKVFRYCGMRRIRIHVKSRDLLPIEATFAFMGVRQAAIDTKTSE